MSEATMRNIRLRVISSENEFKEQINPMQLKVFHKNKNLRWWFFHGGIYHERQYVDHTNWDFDFLIEHLVSNKEKDGESEWTVVGWVHVARCLRGDTASIDYLIIDREYRKGQFATVAMYQLFDLLFGEYAVRRISASCAGANKATMGFYKKYMVEEGRRRTYWPLPNKRYCDKILYGIMREEWKALKKILKDKKPEAGF